MIDKVIKGMGAIVVSLLIIISIMNNSFNNQVLISILIIFLPIFSDIFKQINRERFASLKLVEFIIIAYLLFVIFRLLFDYQLAAANNYNYTESFLQYRLMAIIVLSIIIRFFYYIASEPRVPKSFNQKINLKYLLVLNIAILFLRLFASKISLEVAVGLAQIKEVVLSFIILAILYKLLKGEINKYLLFVIMLIITSLYSGLIFNIPIIILTIASLKSKEIFNFRYNIDSNNISLTKL